MRQPVWSSIVSSFFLAGLAASHAHTFAAAPTQSREAAQREAAAMVQRVGELRHEGRYAEAVAAGRTAVARAEEVFGRDDPRTGAAKRALAAAYLEVDDRTAAAPLLRDAIVILERADPPDGVALSYALGDLAQTVASAAEAESLYRRALALAEKAAGADQAVTGHALNNLGWFLYEQDRALEAEPLMRQAVRVRERTDGLASPSTAQSLCTLGSIAGSLGDISVAESLVRRSLELRRAVLPQGHPDVAESCARLAQILLAEGKERAREAYALAAEAFDTHRHRFGSDSMATLFAMHLKADALAVIGRHSESDRLHQELIEKVESLPGPDLAVLARAIGEFGEHTLQAGSPEKAVALFRRAVAVQRKAAADDAAVVALRQRLAEALYASGAFAEAVNEARDIVAALEQGGGDSAPMMGFAKMTLAKCLLGTGEMDEARRLLRDSMAVFERTTGRGSRETLQAMYLLATTYTVTDELAEAERLIDDGLGRVAAHDVRTISVAGDLIGLRAVIYRKTGRFEEAAEAEAIAKQIEAEERRR